MAWVNHIYQCSECLEEYDNFEDAKECCDWNKDY